MDNSNILNVLTDHYLEPEVCCPTNWQHLETIANSHYLLWSICGVNLQNFTTIDGKRMRCYILPPPTKFYLAHRGGNCNNVTLACLFYMVECCSAKNENKLLKILF
jgi:hypothetical protein